MKLPAAMYLTILIIGLLVSPAPADRIDFEAGFARMDPVTSVATATNQVTFSTMGQDNSQPFVAEVGTTPKNAFENRIDGVVHGDTPHGGEPGRYFMTDGAGNTNNYLFDLHQPVNQFALDLYDYVGDGGAMPTDVATLRGYSDHERTHEVASNQYVVPSSFPPDGLAVNLGISAPEIRAVTLEFTTFDRGTGVDNIQFVTVPEPSGLALISVAALATLGGVGYTRRRRSSR